MNIQNPERFPSPGVPACSFVPFVVDGALPLEVPNTMQPLICWPAEMSFAFLESHSNESHGICTLLWFAFFPLSKKNSFDMDLTFQVPIIGGVCNFLGSVSL